MEKILQEVLTGSQQEIIVLENTISPCKIDSMKIGERIKDARTKMSLNQSELARDVGVKPQAVQAWESGKNSPSRKSIQILSNILQVSAHWLEFGTAYPSDSSHAAEFGPFMVAEAGSIYAITEKKKGIPVIGTTQAGPDRHWKDLGYPTGWGEEYAVIESDDPHAYILRVEGDSMSPRINEGDYVLVEPSTEAQPGDIIVTKLNSGEVMLKYFRADYGEEIMLESHNHGFTAKTIRKTDIVFIHAISGILLRRKIKKRI